jgi:plastocyanin
MKRSLLAVAVAAVAISAAVAGVSGAFSSSHRPGHRATAAAVVATTTTMPMNMPKTAAGGGGPLRIELHRRVVRVTIMNFAFVPARIEVSPGTRVVWTNRDSDPHTVTTDRPGFSSQALDTGQSYAEVVSRAGTVTYHCTIHPFMHGSVVVRG